MNMNIPALKKLSLLTGLKNAAFSETSLTILIKLW
jgi:hypothetical protein